MEERNKNENPLDFRTHGRREERKVDKVVKETTEKVGTHRCPERFASLPHVRHKILKRKWKDSEHQFKTENDCCPTLQRAWYDPAFESQRLYVAAMEKAVRVSR